MTVKVAFKGQRLSKVALCPPLIPPIPFALSAMDIYPLNMFAYSAMGGDQILSSGVAGYYFKDLGGGYV